MPPTDIPELSKAEYFHRLFGLGDLSDEDDKDLTFSRGVPGPAQDGVLERSALHQPKKTYLRPSTSGSPKVLKRVLSDPIAGSREQISDTATTKDILINGQELNTRTCHGYSGSSQSLALNYPSLRRISSAPTPTSSVVSGNMFNSKKRSRKEPLIRLLPEGQRIFNGLTFYYIPNDDISPVRRARIIKARERGVTWARTLNKEVTHVVVEKHLTYQDIVPFLNNIYTAVNYKIVNAEYPVECIEGGAVFDCTQQRYRIKGQPDGTETAGNQTHALQQATSLLPSSRDTNTTKNSSPSNVTNKPLPCRRELSVPQARAKTRALTRAQNVLSNSNITDSSPELDGQPGMPSCGDELDDMISEMRDVAHLPLDEDGNDSEGSFAASQSQSTQDQDSGNESASPPRKKVKGRKELVIADRPAYACMKGGDGVTKETNPNAHVIDIFQQMGHYYDRMRDSWRPQAYRRACTMLRAQTERITTYEKAIELPGFGHRLSTKLVEIVLTHRLRRLDDALADPNDVALGTFTQIYGVGFVTAARWVQKGYKTLDDLVKHADLTSNQRLGIEHYDDLKSRIPRSEVTALGDVAQRAAKTIDPQVEVIIGGSYRRGASDCGDIDFILTKPGTSDGAELQQFLKDLVDNLSKAKFLVAALTTLRVTGGSKWHGCCVLPSAAVSVWRRIDFLVVPATELGAALIYFTGNDLFNRSIRNLAGKKGMRLNQRGLYKNVMRTSSRAKMTEGELVEGADEKVIFENLGVPWRPPNMRIC